MRTENGAISGSIRIIIALKNFIGTPSQPFDNGAQIYLTYTHHIPINYAFGFHFLYLRYTGSLNEIFYDCKGIINAFNEVLEKPEMEKIEILLLNKPTQYPTKFSRLWRENEKRIIVYEPSDSLTLRNHFFVSDTEAYRFEEEHTSDDFNDGNVKASVNFKDEAMIGSAVLITVE